LIGHGQPNNLIEKWFTKELYTFKNKAKIRYAVDLDENASSIPLHLLECNKTCRLKRNIHLVEDYIKRFIGDVYTYKAHQKSFIPLKD